MGPLAQEMPPTLMDILSSLKSTEIVTLKDGGWQWRQTAELVLLSLLLQAVYFANALA